MARQQSSPAQSVVRVDVAGLIADVKQRIQSAQTRAVLAVNSELVRLYWDIGRLIANRQQREGWGAGVIPRLASQLKHELPGLKGFSERNIDRMIAFYLAYPGQGEISPPPVAKLTQAKLTRAKKSATGGGEIVGLSFLDGWLGAPRHPDAKGQGPRHAAVG